MSDNKSHNYSSWQFRQTLLTNFQKFQSSNKKHILGSRFWFHDKELSEKYNFVNDTTLLHQDKTE